MASTNKDDVGVQIITVPDWSGGIVTSQPPTEIPDNAAQDILNMELDDNGNLTSRCGLTQLNSTTFAGRITSLHYFKAESGEIGILFTTGTSLRIIETDGTGLTNLTGVLVLPSDTFWQWKTFNGIAIGVNKATSGDNPVKVTTAAAASALGGSPPKAKYIEVWNNRVWLVSATEPNQLWGSTLGDPENWTVSGDDDAITIDIDPDDGDLITGLFATRSALYVFKRNSIHKVVPIDAAQAPTLASNLKVEIHAQTVGCVSPYSIFPVLDDVVFLSEQGLASLTLAADTEAFRTALYSRNVNEIQRAPKITEEIPGFLFDTAAQYWLSLPSGISPTGLPVAYVMDYLRIDQQITRWSRFDGLAGFTAATAFTGANGKVYVLGSRNPAGEYQLYTYFPRQMDGPFSDNGVGYSKQLKTKAYTAGFPLLRKWWKKWGFGFMPLTNSLSITVQYVLDENLTKGGSYGFSLSAQTLGSLWDQAIWDSDVWDSDVQPPVDIVRKLLTNSSGQRSQSIYFTVSNSQDEEGFVIRDFMLIYQMLSEKKVSDV